MAGSDSIEFNDISSDNQIRGNVLRDAHRSLLSAILAWHFHRAAPINLDAKIAIIARITTPPYEVTYASSLFRPVVAPFLRHFITIACAVAIL